MAEEKLVVLDHSVMYAGASDKLMDRLCRNHPTPDRVEKYAVEVKTQFTTVPNYICYGTNDFRDPSGVYQVGRRRNLGPIRAIPNNTQKFLSEIIGGSGSGGVIGSKVYWLCCRAGIDNSNNIDDNADEIIGHRVGGLKMGAIEHGSSTGLKPSQVKSMNRWR
jgi:hypothetical protein